MSDATIRLHKPFERMHEKSFSFLNRSLTLVLHEAQLCGALEMYIIELNKLLVTKSVGIRS